MISMNRAMKYSNNLKKKIKYTRYQFAKPFVFKGQNVQHLLRG